MSEEVVIDGSHGEGGGAILRTALSLSVASGKSFRIEDIRKNRDTPGLKNQHIHCIEVLQEFSDAETSELSKGAESLEFEPRGLRPKNVYFDMKTAASITLVAQSLLLPALLSGGRSKVVLEGGTNVPFSQPVDYFINVVSPMLERLGFGSVQAKIKRRGFYPKGGGKVEIVIESDKMFGEPMESVDLVERGSPLSSEAVVFATQDLESADVCQRARGGVKSVLPGVSVQMEYCRSPSTGAGAVTWKEYSNTVLGSDCLGKKGLKSEKMGGLAGEELKNEIDSEAVVDKYLADQLIPFLGVAKGEFKTSKITDHTLSNIYVAEKFLDAEFEVDKEEGVVRAD